MNTVIVWLLMFTQYQGGMIIVPNHFETKEECVKTALSLESRMGDKVWPTVSRTSGTVITCIPVDKDTLR